MLKCAICEKEFRDNQLDEYAAHVQECVAKESMRRKTEDMKKINQELEEVKRAKVVFEGLRDQFKEKYPDIYKVNFSDECVCKCCSDDGDDDYYDNYDFSVDFSDLERVINELFGYNYKKRN